MCLSLNHEVIFSENNIYDDVRSYISIILFSSFYLAIQSEYDLLYLIFWIPPEHSADDHLNVKWFHQPVLHLYIGI